MYKTGNVLIKEKKIANVGKGLKYVPEQHRTFYASTHQWPEENSPPEENSAIAGLINFY